MIAGSSVEVGDIAVALNMANSAGCRLTVKNDGSEPADLGPVDVMVGSGYELADEETVELQLKSGEVMYAISAEGTTLKVLRT